MKNININKTIKGFAAAFAMVMGLMLFAGTEANAQYRQGDRNYNNNGRYDNDRYDNNNSNRYRQAMERGFQDGLRQGMEDARRRHRFGAQDSRSYRNPGGYNQGWGSRSAFEQAYREGFSRGYREGFDRVDRNNRGNRNGRWN